MPEFNMKSSITSQTKFTSELDVNNPSDRAEMTRRVFGNEDGIRREPLSHWSLTHGKTPVDVIQAHLKAVLKAEGQEKHDQERDRIRSLQAASGQKVTV